MADTRQQRHRLPVAGWLPGYRRTLFGKDTVGALTACALIVPECVAYAQIAGVPIQNAFYGAPVALLAYALFGTSSRLIVGATSAASVLSASTVSAVSGDGAEAASLSAALALIAGAILLAAGLARLGFVADFLSEPVLVGFLFGMALTIVVRQLAKITGVPTGDGDFFQRLWHELAHLPDWGWASVAVGVAGILALLALERLVPRLPASLIVLAAGIIVSAIWHLDRHGVEIVGRIPRAVPTPAWPDLPRHEWAGLIGGAFGLALVVFAESYSIAHGFAVAHRERIDASREMTAMGAANAAVGLFRGFAVSGSASRTAATDASGASTPMTSVVAAVIVLVIAAFLTPLFTDLPEPVLGAIVIVAVRGFLRVGELRRYRRLDPRSLALALTALLGVLVFDLLPGLVIAVALSLLMLIAYSSRPRVAVLGRIGDGHLFGDLTQHRDARATPRVAVLRPDAQLYFGNINHISNDVITQMDAAQPTPEVVVIDLSASYRLGLPVRDTLEVLGEQLESRGIELWYVHVRAQADLEPPSPAGSGLPEDHPIYPDPDAALRAFTDRNTPPARS